MLLLLWYRPTLTDTLCCRRCAPCPSLIVLDILCPPLVSSRVSTPRKAWCLIFIDFFSATRSSISHPKRDFEEVCSRNNPANVSTLYSPKIHTRYVCWYVIYCPKNKYQVCIYYTRTNALCSYQVRSKNITPTGSCSLEDLKRSETIEPRNGVPLAVWWRMEPLG